MAKRADVNRLAQYGSLHKEKPDFDTLDDIQGHDVLVTGVEWFEGDFGQYVIMSVVDGDDEIKVRTGAMLVVDALTDAEANDAFPLAVTFKRRGRTWRFA
ncbi:MAG: hypothetical protein KKD44_25980 [Proteobacteria bacterium]|nr:hypothetical protein [Pseudomonadota bacterium]